MYFSTLNVILKTNVTEILHRKYAVQTKVKHKKRVLNTRLTLFLINIIYTNFTLYCFNHISTCMKYANSCGPVIN